MGEYYNRHITDPKEKLHLRLAAWKMPDSILIPIVEYLLSDEPDNKLAKCPHGLYGRIKENGKIKIMKVASYYPKENFNAYRKRVKKELGL